MSQHKLHVEIPSPSNVITVYADQLGMTPQPDICNAAPMQHALDFAKVSHAGIFTFPKGDYYFHQFPFQEAHVVLDDFNDFTIDGQGSTFLFDGLRPMLLLTHCSRIIIKNLTIKFLGDYPDHALRIGALSMYDCNHITLDHVSILSSPGHGIRGNGDVHHIRLQGCVISRPAEQAPGVTILGDGIHFGDTNGRLIIQDCDICDTGRSSISLWNHSYMPCRAVDANTLHISAADVKYPLFEAGYFIQLICGDEKDYHMVEDVITHLDQGEFLLTLREPMSDAYLHGDFYLLNCRYDTRYYEITHCRLLDCDGHGIRTNYALGTIQDCTFAHLAQEPIHISPEAEDVDVRHNYYRHC